MARGGGGQTERDRVGHKDFLDSRKKKKFPNEIRELKKLATRGRTGWNVEKRKREKRGFKKKREGGGETRQLAIWGHNKESENGQVLKTEKRRKKAAMS